MDSLSLAFYLDFCFTVLYHHQIIRTLDALITNYCSIKKDHGLNHVYFLHDLKKFKSSILE